MEVTSMLAETADPRRRRRHPQALPLVPSCSKRARERSLPSGQLPASAKGSPTGACPGTTASGQALAACGRWREAAPTAPAWPASCSARARPCAKSSDRFGADSQGRMKSDSPRRSDAPPKRCPRAAPLAHPRAAGRPRGPARAPARPASRRSRSSAGSVSTSCARCSSPAPDGPAPPAALTRAEP